MVTILAASPRFAYRDEDVDSTVKSIERFRQSVVRMTPFTETGRMSPSDEEGFRRFVEGLTWSGTGAFWGFWEELEPQLYQYARRSLPHHEAEEAVQDASVAFVRAVRDRKIFIRSPKAYLFGILTNKIAERMRKRKHRERSNSGQLEVEPAGEPDALTRLLKSEEHQRVRDAVHFLSETQREVIKLSYFADLSITEVAEVLDIPAGTVKSRLHAARLALIRRLRGGTGT